MMMQRYLIVAGLLVFYVLAGCYIAHGKPAYVPKLAPVRTTNHHFINV